MRVHLRSWFKPAMISSQWKGFGQNGTIQGKCCGPFKTTLGAKPGKGSQLCGTYMYNELQAALGTTSTESAFPIGAGASCHAVSPAATDDWCNMNCNHVPPNCPADLCSCGPPAPPPPPGPAGGGVTFHDEQSASDIAYFPAAGADDGYTEAGTWVSYTGPRSLTKISEYATSKSLAGVFVFDTSQDTIDSSGQPTYELLNQLDRAIHS